ncbi:TetR family transcriptional regulator [Tsukamurella sputi]|uniref:TetR family transcriptional regulator n=1 Tax=Tsukamurella sputi TaxID=2591848 RepID=A0A5C5RKS1_9ACTN|nr:TetR family transcriptional regulator C-terminal domain-containing protein [Tsukamurella sputi]TWS23626.1 TetR family transcriptional regulator [Tsukamurella sputi]
MPKVVDPAERRNAIAAAAIETIARGGLDKATLANVAAQAGLAVGSVRHYFEGQASMIEFAMRWLADRIGARVLAIAGPVLAGEVGTMAERRRATVDLLCELLPLDETRRREVTAWLALSAAAVYRPGLRPIVDDMHESVRGLTRVIVERSRAAGLSDGDDADLDADVERLAALIDGLAVDAILRPDRYSPQRMRSVVERQLDRLGSPGADRT